MSKLFKLKEWLTIQDAARYLSNIFGEEVNEADILRLALDGHLKLSVNFVNHTQGKCGKVVPFSQSKWKLFPRIKHEIHITPVYPPAKILECPPDLEEKLKEILEAERDNYFTLPEGLIIDEERVLELGENVTSIKGVWDLSMIGAERIDIEYQYQQITGGPEVTLQALDGAFIERTDGAVFQLQTDYEDNEYSAGSNAQLETLKRHITNNKIEQAEAQQLLDKHKQDRKEFLELRASKPNAQNYFPAGGLPEDGVLVVRTDALRNFEQSLNETPNSTEKPLTTTERNTLLTIIAALCDYSKIDHQGRGAAAQIARLTEASGARVSEDAISKALKKIPNALESRMK